MRSTNDVDDGEVFGGNGHDNTGAFSKAFGAGYRKSSLNDRVNPFSVEIV